jgi:hypothetical protein
LFNYGFGDKESCTNLYSNKRLLGWSSLYPHKLDHLGISLDQAEIIGLRTLDSFCNEKKINHIDFLKMDIEGHEFKELKGAVNLINSRSIDFIQFEFWPCNIDSNTYFCDFFYLLHSNSNLYRILKYGISHINQYNEINELVIGTTNYLAISRNW